MDDSTIKSAVREQLDDLVAPDAGRPNVIPNAGQTPLPHVMSFVGLTSAISDVYRDADEAVKNSVANARFMRNDIGIMECILARERMVALLDWHVKPEDEKNAAQKDVAEKLTKCLTRMRRFTEYRRWLMEAIWYGRSAVQHRWGRQNIAGATYVMPSPEIGKEHSGWLPINGDKLVFRHDLPQHGGATHLGQVGVLINRSNLGNMVGEEHVEATPRGAAYFLPTWQRRLIAIHKHEIEDAAYETPIDAGAVNGVGLRSRIYWEWFQKQEVLAYLLEYLERSAAGMEIWEYPSGNPDAKKAVEDAALQRGPGTKNVILFPKPVGDDAALFNMQLVEPGMAGAQMLLDMIEKYYGHRIKRLILGQTLTSEADATGLGSGVADLHLDTLMQIVRYDASNLAETLTYQLVEPLRDFNFPDLSGSHFEFVIQAEDPQAEKVLSAYQQAWSMGARLKESDVLAAIGASAVGPDDVVLQNQPQQPGGMPGEQSLQSSFKPQAGFGSLTARIHQRLQQQGLTA